MPSPSVPNVNVNVNEIEVDFAALKLLIAERWHNIEARPLQLPKSLLDNHGRQVSPNQSIETDILVQRRVE
jgi:hypothetical protein